MGCQSNPPPPAGYKIWKGAVPTPLTQWAMDLRDHIAPWPYGQTWTLDYNGQAVVARKDYHSWTYKNGVLVSGICIPGITLYTPSTTGGVEATGAGDPSSTTPDPTLAVYGANDVPVTEVIAPAASPWWPIVIGASVGVAVAAGLYLLSERVKHNPIGAWPRIELRIRRCREYTEQRAGMFFGEWCIEKLVEVPGQQSQISRFYKSAESRDAALYWARDDARQITSGVYRSLHPEDTYPQNPNPLRILDATGRCLTAFVAGNEVRCNPRTVRGTSSTALQPLLQVARRLP